MQIERGIVTSVKETCSGLKELQNVAKGFWNCVILNDSIL